ncbi:putative bacteriophage Mu Gam like protein [Paenibacillus sp. oral taxon 786 str. D14]|uniref:host-nuclease inhibitor Gam family protein n=1 Tax=Paenibacillus sp. oral taxon 786 TaxID=652715 RepID=UPI0001AFD2FE|nr:host-nuclease inhibitor Gam family protein [Paenibacillus sp. oral taxon 786]EES73472.1 putative bacteriophage Mu Gam like protein [Paenibacillus sp. oral taxon 786 str. D14]
MARVRIPDQPALKSWDDVDLTLKEIGECQLAIERIEAEMNAQISDIKLAAEMSAKPHKERIKLLELQMKAFVEANRDDLGNKKTKEINFGRTGFRKSTKIVLPRAAAKLAEVIRRLKEFGMTDCIIQPPEKIDKDNLKKYPENDILKVGASLTVEDTFWYEVDREKLADL